MRKTFFISLLALCLTASAWAVNVNDLEGLRAQLIDATVSEVTLTADIDVPASQSHIVIAGDKVIDLNGHTITTATNYFLEVGTTNGTNTVTVTGNGRIEATRGALDVYSKLIVANGTFVGTEKFAIYGNPGSQITINGGTFSSTNGTALIANNAAANINGGAVSGVTALCVVGPNATAVIGGNASLQGTDTGIEIDGNAESADLNREAKSAIVTMNGGSVSGTWAVTLWGKGAQFVLNNGTVTGTDCGISGNGTAKYNGTVIEVNGGTINGGSAAIYHPQEGTLTVTGGTLTGGDVAIEIRAGELNINGGTFTSTAIEYSCNPNGTGSTTVGAAIAIAQHTTKKDIAVTINGGTFNGIKAVNESNPQVNDPAPQVDMAVTDGTFNGEVTTTDVNNFISGGEFINPVQEEQCAPGYDPATTVNANGKYVVELVNVAKIGATLYPTLEAALAHASEGAIILLADVDVTAQVEIAAGVNAVIDLAGHKIEYTGATTLPSGVLLVHNGASLTINDSSDPDAGAIVSGNKAYAAIALTKKDDDPANPAILIVNGGNITGYYYAITGNGSRHNTITTINGGVLTGTCPGDNTGIYHPQMGTLTINNGTITAYSAAVEMRAGTLEINGGTLTATAPTFTCNANGSGTTTVGAAIAIAQHTTKRDIGVTINGGEFNGVKAINESNPQVNDPAPQVTMSVTDGEFNGAVETVDVNNFVTGGTFDAPVAEAYCAPGFVSVTAPNAQGLYVVVVADYIREVTTTYGTLCLPKDGEVIGATVFRPAYKNCAMIFFEEVDGNRIEGGHGYLFQRKADYTKVSVKYDDANALPATLVTDEAMIGTYDQVQVAADQNYAIIYNDKYYRVNSDNVYVRENGAYINMTELEAQPVAPVPGRRYISFQDASVNEVTGIEDIEAAENANVQKVMVDGQLYIIRGEQIYNVAGQVVK